MNIKKNRDITAAEATAVRFLRILRDSRVAGRRFVTQVTQKGTQAGWKILDLKTVSVKSIEEPAQWQAQGL